MKISKLTELKPLIEEGVALEEEIERYKKIINEIAKDITDEKEIRHQIRVTIECDVKQEEVFDENGNLFGGVDGGYVNPGAFNSIHEMYARSLHEALDKRINDNNTIDVELDTVEQIEVLDMKIKELSERREDIINILKKHDITP